MRPTFVSVSAVRASRPDKVSDEVISNYCTARPPGTKHSRTFVTKQRKPRERALVLRMSLRSRLRAWVCVCQQRSASCHYGKIHINNQDVSSHKPRDPAPGSAQKLSDAESAAAGRSADAQAALQQSIGSTMAITVPDAPMSV